MNFTQSGTSFFLMWHHLKYLIWLGNRYSATSTVKKVMDEITKMECLNHPNVMSLLGVCLEEVAIGIVMPRMAESLLDYLRNNRKRLKPLSSNSEVCVCQTFEETGKNMAFCSMHDHNSVM